MKAKTSQTVHLALCSLLSFYQVQCAVISVLITDRLCCRLFSFQTFQTKSKNVFWKDMWLWSFSKVISLSFEQHKPNIIHLYRLQIVAEVLDIDIWRPEVGEHAMYFWVNWPFKAELSITMPLNSCCCCFVIFLIFGLGLVMKLWQILKARLRK